MTPATLLDRAHTLYKEGAVESAHRHLDRARNQVDDDKEFKKLLKYSGLTEVERVLREHVENTEWLGEQKDLYGPLFDSQIAKHVTEQRKKAPRVLEPLLPWNKKRFRARQTLKWEEDAANSILAHAKEELQSRITELANLQVRLSLILTLTTAMLAVVSLWSQQRSATTVSIATVVGCLMLGISLMPMRSSFRQAWINKHVDAVVWAIQSVDPLCKLCILKGATHARNTVITRYKRVLWLLVGLALLVLLGVAVVSSIPLFR